MLGQTYTDTGFAAVRDRGVESSSDGRDRVPARSLRNGLEQQFAPLIRTIESEIIPRLLLAHKTEGLAEDSSKRGEIPGIEQVVEFANLLLTQSPALALAHVNAMVDQGYLLETLYLELLAPAARHLGELWEQDLCDFVDVTLALGRMQQVIREFSPVFRESRVQTADTHRILLAPAPGEQHSMGLMMVKEFFARAGWEVTGGPGVSGGEVRSLVASEWFDSVGISAGVDCRLDGLAAWLCEIREASKNPGIAILMGGPTFNLHPELAGLLGADGTACDARAAVSQAEALVARRG